MSVQHTPQLTTCPMASAISIIAISTPPVRTHNYGRSWAQTWPLSPVPSMIQAHTGANNLSQRTFLPRKCGCNPCSGPTRSKVPHSRVGYHRKLSSPPRLAPPAPVCHPHLPVTLTHSNVPRSPANSHRIPPCDSYSLLAMEIRHRPSCTTRGGRQERLQHS